MRVYFDYNATSPVAPEVADAVDRATRDLFGNASSVHYYGQQAKAAIDQARSAIAELIRRRSVGNRLHERRHRVGQLRDSRYRRSARADRPAPSGRDRHRARGGAQYLQGTRPPRLEHHPGAGGSVRRRVAGATFGRRSPTRPRSCRSCTPTTRSAPSSRSPRSPPSRTSVAPCCTPMPSSRSARFRSMSGCWAWMRWRCRRTSSAVPKGLARSGSSAGSRMLPILTGGKHERNRRAGTENVPAIAGLGAAARLAGRTRWPRKPSACARLRDRLEEEILRPGAGNRDQRRP